MGARWVREAARQRLFLFLDYFWEEKEAFCFYKPFFALFSCFGHSHLKWFWIQEARAQWTSVFFCSLFFFFSVYRGSWNDTFFQKAEEALWIFVYGITQLKKQWVFETEKENDLYKVFFFFLVYRWLWFCLLVSRLLFGVCGRQTHTHKRR